MGYIRTRLGIGKSVMWGSLGVFHLFLAVSFLAGRTADPVQTGTGLLLLFVGSGMIVWGYSHRRRS